ncbi:MAG: hypothetical protein JSR81_11030, partial [Proteobacteria bacterium]|nr:hypothetical protein [Pseudomonadota bacterium]
LQKLHDAGRITTATLSKLSAAYANFAVETANQKTLGDAWTSLTAGQLNTGLMEEGKGKKGRTGKGGGGGGGSPITAMADELRASEYKIREDTGDWLADMGDLEVDFWQAKAAEAKKGSKLYGEIIDKLEAAQQAAGVRAAQQQRQIADSDTSTDLSLAKAGFGRRREAASFTFDRALADEAAAAEIGAAQRKRDALAAIAHEEARAEIAAIEAKAAARGKDVVAEVEAANQVRIINSNLKSQLAALDRQFTADHEREVEKRKAMDERAAQQTAQAWRGFNQQVLAAEGQLIQGFISGRQSMGRTLLQVGANLVVQEIQQDVRYWTERKLLQAQGLNVEQATSQKGILLHLLTAQRKTAITTAGLASETAATTAAEVARTTATQAGSTARQVVEQGAAKLTGAVASALAGKQIASQAAVGAAGAYASQAPIPIVGPMLGAAEAVLVQAAIMKFASLASFDRGTNYIPSDMLAQVHAGERIIPAADNRRLMEAVGEAGPRGSRGSGSQQGGGNTYHINISAIDAHSVKRWARENGAALAGGVQHAIRNGYRGG